MLTIADFTSWIFEFRGKKVMLDTDLAALYDTETKRLKQQVKRNIDRFPDDFMFVLTKEERSQLLANNSRLINLKFSSAMPMVFTEQGVSMLSSVLSSDKAIQVNIGIMRTFAHYRTLLLENSELKKDIFALDKKLNESFKYLLERLDQLSEDTSSRAVVKGFQREKK